MKTKKLLLVFASLIITLAAFSQSVLTGDVRNEKGEPLAGATVSVQNKSGSIRKSVQSAKDGSFSIADLPAASDYKLNVSYIGYTTQVIERVANNGTRISVRLETATGSNEAVVVVAYSTQKKANLTGAVDQVSG